MLNKKFSPSCQNNEMIYQAPEQWQPRWYYRIRNKKTGKWYVGQHKKDDIGVKYFGSGPYWIAHCKKHGGLNQENIEVLEKVYFEDERIAREWLEELKLIFGDYWLLENCLNEVPENTKNNPNYNGEVNRKRVANGTHPWLGEKHGKHQTQKNLKMVADGTHPFLGGDMQRAAQLKLVADGTHHLLDGKMQRAAQLKLVADRTHPWLDKEKQRQTRLKQVADGTHPFLGERNPNKKKWRCSETNIVSTKTGFTNMARRTMKIDKWPHPLIQEK